MIGLLVKPKYHFSSIKSTDSKAVIVIGKAVYTNYSEIGKQIKKRLIDKNMTARQLAAAVGTSPQYLNSILHGRKPIDKYREAIQKVLEMDIITREGGEREI